MRRALIALAVLCVACTDNIGTPSPGPDPQKEPEQQVKWPAPQQNPVPGEIDPGQFTILSWSDLMGVGRAEWKFSKLVEAGFDTYLGWFDTYDEVETALAIADTLGLKLITSSPELFSDTEATVAKMKMHPSLLGYHIMDEPVWKDFEELSSKVSSVSDCDGSRFCYVNLMPTYWCGVPEYQRYLDEYFKMIPEARFLSFDHYPIRQIDGVKTVREDWYENLEMIRSSALEHDVPFWAFAVSLSHLDYPVPTIGDLRLQMFSNLVYGATGFQYFTTWGHIQSTEEGVATQYVTGVYNLVKIMNSELRGLQEVFLGADIKGIWHTGASIPQGTRPLGTLPDGISRIETGDEGTVVSWFVNNGKQYIAFVNRSCTGGVDVDIEFDTQDFHKIDKAGNTFDFEPGPVRIPAGDILLFTWQ